MKITLLPAELTRVIRICKPILKDAPSNYITLQHICITADKESQQITAESISGYTAVRVHVDGTVEESGATLIRPDIRIPKTGSVTLESTGASYTVTELPGGNATTHLTHLTEDVAGRFKRMSDIYKPNDDYRDIYVNPKLLKRIAASFCERGFKYESTMCLRIPEDPNHAILLQRGEDVGVLMPVKGDG